MDADGLQKTLLCPVRGIELLATPEERVRCDLLARMVGELGYPASMLSIERALDQVPHLQGVDGLPDRRFDVVCFSSNIHPSHALYPLLLVECKAVPLDRTVLTQVTGYNHYLQAYFVAVVNQDEIRVGWVDHDSGEYQYIQRLPSYPELRDAVS